MREHYEELAYSRHGFLFDPWWGAYEALESHGNLVAFAAEGKRAEVVGYSVSILQKSMHDQTSIVCRNDVLFVTRRSRFKGIGGRLIKSTEQEALRRGAIGVAWHAKPGSDTEALLKRHYDASETTFYRRL